MSIIFYFFWISLIAPFGWNRKSMASYYIIESISDGYSCWHLHATLWSTWWDECRGFHIFSDSHRDRIIFIWRYLSSDLQPPTAAHLLQVLGLGFIHSFSRTEWIKSSIKCVEYAWVVSTRKTLHTWPCRSFGFCWLNAMPAWSLTTKLG